MTTMQALILDHDDSFVWNISAWLKPYFKVTIIDHQDTKKTNLDDFDLIILSPGPKAPTDYPDTIHLIKTLPDQKAVLGICLGMQMITMAHQGVVQELPHPVHGKRSLFLSEKHKNWDKTMVARYHSLYCIPSGDFKIEGTTQDNIIMWMQHYHKKQIGIQFHPESFLTEKSAEMSKYISQWVNNE